MTPALPPPLAVLWTEYEHDPAAGPRSRCLRCGEPISDGRTVRIYPDGLIHYLCWIAASVAAARVPAPPPRRRSSTPILLAGTIGTAIGGGALAAGAPVVAALAIGWGGSAIAIGLLLRGEGG